MKKPAAKHDGQARPHHSGPITNDQAARITWDSLPTVKSEPVVLAVKSLFEISGGTR